MVLKILQKQIVKYNNYAIIKKNPETGKDMTQ